ncbi:hypothetical protein KJ865_01745, partial [Myxococcota bacterium]|nr:hypothetical protein [Myxococcota bacterium]
IAVRRATTLFTGKTACNTVKLYKIKRVHATQSEQVFFFRLGGCNTAMDFMVQCVKWSHTCPEGRMLLFMKGKPGINMEPLFNKLPLTTKQQ